VVPYPTRYVLVRWWCLLVGIVLCVVIIYHRQEEAPRDTPSLSFPPFLYYFLLSRGRVARTSLKSETAQN